MIENKPFTDFQLITLLFLRLLIGWHLLYEGISKLLNEGWSSIGFLQESQWVLSGFAKWILSNGTVLTIVDFLNIWGLIIIGICLILGLFSRTTAIIGALLLLLYYLNNAPIIGIEYSIPSEGNNLIVNKTLIEAVALCVIAALPTSTIFGLDALTNRIKLRKKMNRNEN